MTNGDHIRQMSDDELATLLKQLMDISYECGQTREIPCWDCPIAQICDSASEYVKEEY